MTKQKDSKYFKVMHILEYILMYVVLALLAIMILFPFYIMTVSSFKSYAESLGEFTWWPKKFTVEAYSMILGNNPYDIKLWRSLFNTLFIVIPPIFFSLTMSAMSAYTFAKRNFLGKKVLFAIMLSTMFLPGVATTVSSYLIFSDLGWVDTVLPLMVPSLFGGCGTVFFLRQFMFGIPTDLVEAARIDGMRHPGIFFKIIVPLSVPALLTQGVLMFMGGYNDYMGPLIYLHSPEMETLQVTLQRLVGIMGDALGDNYPAMLAGSLVTLLPLIIIYIFAQKFFKAGIAVSGLKV